MNPCMNCGSDVGDENPPRASHCRNCPPTRCDDCGQMCDWSEGGKLCCCWTDLTGMAMADVKALFTVCDCDDEKPALSLDPEARP